MKNIILILPMVFFLTACPSEKDVKEMVDGISTKRSQAIQVISASDYSLDGLLKTQDYFFDISEKVHLMREDQKALDGIKAIIKRDGLKKFCENFIVSIRHWQMLENYCSASSPYRCSPDIQNYENVQKKFLELIGSDLSRKFNNEKACN